MSLRNGWLVSILVPAAVAAAQQPGGIIVDFDADRGMGDSVVMSPVDRAASFIAEQGWNQGQNGEGESSFYVSIASRSYPCKADDREFDRCRQQAFDEMMLNAKAAIAQKLAVEVATEYRALAAEPDGWSRVVSGSGSNGSLRGEIAQQVSAAIQAELRSKGIDPASPAAADYLKNLMLIDTFDRAIRAVARAEIGGVQAFRVYEEVKSSGSGSVAGVLTWSPRSRQLQKALLGIGEAPQGAPSENISRWLMGLDAEEVLLFTGGCQARFNERGELSLVGFGRSNARTKSDRALDNAYEKANIEALAQMRNYLGELVLLEGQIAGGSTMTELAEGESRYRSTEEFARQIRTRADSLSMPGNTEARRWTATHPASELPSAGIVLVMTVDGAREANRFREELNRIQASRGGVGISTQLPTPPGPGAGEVPASPRRPRGSSSGAGAPGQTP